MRRFCRRSLRAIALFVLASLPFLGWGPERSRDAIVPEISNRINGFTLDLLKHYANGAEAKENAILSPQSIFCGLAVSYVGSSGKTRQELARVFHFPDDDRALLKELGDLRRQQEAVKNGDKIEVSTANSLWLDQTHAEFRKDYVQEIQAVFPASLHSIQFQQAAKASQEINQWVSQQTRGKIKGSVKASDFASRSRPDLINEPALVVVNAVYFKADWGSRFEKEATRDTPFHVDSETTEKAPMMHQHSSLAYATDDTFQFLELPYADRRYSMYLLLPQRILSIKETLARVSAERIIRLKRKSAACNVDVLLPKFTIARHYSVKDAMARMGAKRAFDEDKADFDKMIVKKMEAYRIYISEIYHDAWIEVHEEGTQAAAVTTTTHFSIGCSASPRNLNVDFHADHPFLFAIVDNQSYDILFAGWIAKPDGALVE
jgi:serpin B